MWPRRRRLWGPPLAVSAKCLPSGHSNAEGLLPHCLPQQSIIPELGSPGLTIELLLWHTGLQPAIAAKPHRFFEFSMPAPKPPAFETLSLHAGQHPDPVTGARAVPIYQTTSYVFQDSEHAAALFNLERVGHIYTRISNPTTAVLEERLAALEGGVGAICTASGMAAMHLAIATLLNASDHIVASSSLYGGTINLLAHTLPRFGIATSFVKPRALDQFRAAIQPNTRLVIGETIGNPGLEVLDIPKVADIAHQAKVPLLIEHPF